MAQDTLTQRLMRGILPAPPPPPKNGQRVRLPETIPNQSRRARIASTGLQALMGALGLEDPLSERATPATGVGALLGMIGPAAMVGGLKRIANPIKAYQGSPHNYAAERLIRRAGGREEYIVGRPDVLPDVPEGATVVEDFPLGRIRMNKIGTGEGNQAYGYGGYLAENEGVSRHYRGAGQLSDYAVKLPDGQVVQTRGRTHTQSNEADYAVDALTRYDGDVAQAMGWLSGDSPMDRAAQEWIRRNIKGKKVELVPAGHSYEVNIHARPDELLDWDARLPEQSDYVKRTLQDRFGLNPAVDRGLTGEDINNYVTSLTQGDKGPFVKYAQPNRPAGGAQVLQDSGIPGLRYLDGLSRRAGEGSRNYVIWDEDVLEILRKYGILPPLAAAAAHRFTRPVDKPQGGSIR